VYGEDVKVIVPLVTDEPVSFVANAAASVVLMEMLVAPDDAEDASV
jgi:hypothetical protein